MKPSPLALTVALAAGAVAAGLLLVPDGLEQITILSRDGRYESAVEYGNSLYDPGRTDPRILARLFDLNGYAGDPARASKAILDYIEEKPEDLAMLRHAVAFFRDQQDTDAYTGALARLARLAPDSETVEALANVYQVQGRYEDQKRVLLDNLDLHYGSHVTLRLGQLLARDGRHADAAEVLAGAVERGGGADGAMRSLLFDALVRSGQAERATRLAAGWAEAGLDPALQALFVLTLANAGREEQAAELARMFPRTGRYDPSIMIWALNEQRRFDLARLVVERWMDRADRATAVRAANIYADIATASGRVGDMVADIDRRLAAPDETTMRQGVRMAAVVFSRWGYAGIAPVRARLGDSQLAVDPLFAAELANRENNPLALRNYLLISDLSGVDDVEAEAWYSLAAETLAPAELLDELTGRHQRGQLAASMQPYLQQAAVKARRMDLQWDMLRGGEAQTAPTTRAGT